MLGLLWGVVSSWWFGLILGVLLACAARIGKWPKRSAASLVKPIGLLMLACGTCALLAGFIGHSLATNGNICMIEPLASRVPEERHIAFLTALWAHSASYLAGAIGGIVLAITSLICRMKEHGQ